jgi:hypothetical protein
VRCAQLRTFTVALGGNGTGELAVVTSTGTLTGTIECHRAGGTTYGVCAFSYPTNATVYYKVAAASLSRTTCKVVGCDTTTSIKHFTLTMSMTLSAYGFALLDPVTMTVSATGSGSGTITSKPIGISCGSGNNTCSVAFAAGSTVQLTEVPDSGSTFASWTVGCSGGNNTCSVGMTSGTPVSVTAEFNVVVTATPTPKPTATPTTTPRPSPGATPAPKATARPTQKPTSTGSSPTPAAPTTASPTNGPPEATPGPTSELGQTNGPVAVAIPSLAPLDTPGPDLGESASTGSSRPIVIGGLIVLLIVLGGGALFYLRKSPRAPGR